jgi:iron-sulfur cluster assembly protein
MSQSVFSITEAAAHQLKSLLNAYEGATPPLGIRVGVRARGCSGYSYELDYATEIFDGEETVTEHNITVIVDSKAILFVVGTVMDYVTEDFQSGFVFRNPNEAGRCGCGESFHV